MYDRVAGKERSGEISRNLSDDLNLDQDWRIGEASFARLSSILMGLKPSTIVEFGSGASSVRLALEFPEALIFSVEHDRHFYGNTKSLASRFGVTNLELNCRPLKWQLHGMAFFNTYGPGSFPGKIDAVVIDGPPYTAFRGREGCLYQVWPQLRVGGCAVLDDYNRSTEKSYVESWSQAFGPALSHTGIQASHELCVLSKEGDSSVPVVHPAVLKNWRYTVAHLLR